jgi:UDP-N-acetylglucosamine--N-acetylmuramyl-(pentapeptide) pyrophosphoryl-undecaprenol N-acetylglucosamine transferase
MSADLSQGRELDDGRAERGGSQPNRGRRVLACASSGGHFKQLVSLVDRMTDVGEVTWVTYDRGLSADLLTAAGRGGDALEFVPYAAPRDLANLARNARRIRQLLRAERYDVAVSTGAGIAVAALPVARAMGVRSCFIESATRAAEPSLSGRILERMPGIELFTQNPGYALRWQDVGSVHDEFSRGPDRDDASLQRVVVTLGTISPYGFRRLAERLVEVLPAEIQVFWQTGATDVTGLPIPARASVPGPELESAMRSADLVIAHAGTGTALTAFELGLCPVLVPRHGRYDEHIDDHQVVTAKMLAGRDLVTYLEVEDIDLGALRAAARRTVVRRERAPQLVL